MPSPKPPRIARSPALRYVAVMAACMVFGGIAGAGAAVMGELGAVSVAMMAFVIALG